MSQTVDLLVVGFGAAGSSAAMQALQCAEARKESIDILIVDRLEGGGSTSRSGGIVYLGGGTDVQKKLGIEDDHENMFRYLKMETQGAVADDTLWRFCKTSPETACWLRDSFEMHINVPDDSAVLCPFKTSNAPEKYSLFYSGNEDCHPFNVEARSVPRGHKVIGGLGNLVGTGNVLFRDVQRAILKCKDRGIRVETRTKVTQLVWNADHTCVIGVDVKSMNGAPTWARLLSILVSSYGSLTNPAHQLDPYVVRILTNLEEKYGVSRRIYARKGVVLCAGGFARNLRYVKEHVPRFARLMPIGSAGDDGFGIFELGVNQANASTNNLGFASCWRFIVPAGSMACSVLVSKSTGERLVNEDVYGARLADACIHQADGEAYLIIDNKIRDMCLEEIKNSKELLFFQRLFTFMYLNFNRVQADSLQELARLTGATRLVETIEKYNSMCDAQKDTQFGKHPQLLSALRHPPFYALAYNAETKSWLEPMSPFFTLGGLQVDELTGHVLDTQGDRIPGLFAAGRSASGIPARSYVSGLALADCVFGGRRCGHYAVTQEPFARDVGTPPEFQPPSRL